MDANTTIDVAEPRDEEDISAVPNVLPGRFAQAPSVRAWHQPNELFRRVARVEG